MCQEIEAELEKGFQLARGVVTHLLSMGADSASIPINLEEGPFVVSVCRVDEPEASPSGFQLVALLDASARRQFACAPSHIPQSLEYLAAREIEKLLGPI